MDEETLRELLEAIEPEMHGSRYREDRPTDRVSFQVVMTFGLLDRLAKIKQAMGDPGIPIFSTTEGPKETFQGKRK